MTGLSSCLRCPGHYSSFHGVGIMGRNLSPLPAAGEGIGKASGSAGISTLALIAVCLLVSSPRKALAASYGASRGVYGGSGEWAGPGKCKRRERIGRRRLENTDRE